MEQLVRLLVGIAQNPTALIAVVCVVALLVVAECVKQVCKALANNKGED